MEFFCIARDCPLKDHCLRAMKGTVRKYGGNTSFIPAPFKIRDGLFDCDMFLGNQADVMSENLKRIISKNKNHKNN